METVQAPAHSWVEDLNEEEMAALKACQNRLQLAKGQHLYHYGDIADTGYQIVSGCIEVSNMTEDGRRLLLGIGGSGVCLGDTVLVGARVRVNDAVAVENSTVNSLKRSDFERLCYEFPGVALSMSRFLGRRFQFMMSLVQDANLLPLYDRLGRILVRLCLTNFDLNYDGGILLKDCSQESLGDMVGAVRQSVGREMKKMVDKGLISIEYRSIRVHDLHRLTAEFGKSLAYEPMTKKLLEGME